MAGETPEQGEGRVINGRYRLLRTLGAGGMGRVWLAYDQELACEVAMKEIALPDTPMDASEPAQRIARARSEARHAARLRGHPHVATVHDVVVHEGLPWIVMEYVPDAVDLQAVVRRSGPLPPAEVARIGLAVLDALTAGHRVGILHRDVKPANILLASDASGDPYARVLLTDYGIALQPESREPRLTATAGILGTPGYLAPERARGEPPTPAADMFSLGATLYATVEGRGPFDRQGEYATLTALLGEEPTPPVRAGELAPVLQGLLVKDPVRRSSPEAVARGLERVVQGAAGTAVGGSPGWRAAPSAGAGQGAAGPPQGSFGPPPEGFGVGSGGNGASTPGGHPAGAPAGWSGSAAPGTPQTPGTPPTPGAPPTPNTPPTPHTPDRAPGSPGAGGSGVPGAGGPGSGGPATPGAGDPGGGGPGGGGPSGAGRSGADPALGGLGPATPGGAAGATPGSPPYDAWPPPTAQRPFAPDNPYARAPGSPYGSGGAQSPPYGGGSGAPPYAGGSTPSPYAGSGSPPPHAESSSRPPFAGGSNPAPPYAGSSPGPYAGRGAPSAYPSAAYGSGGYGGGPTVPGQRGDGPPPAAGSAWRSSPSSSVSSS